MLIVYYEVSVIVTICKNQSIDDKKTLLSGLRSLQTHWKYLQKHLITINLSKVFYVTTHNNINELGNFIIELFKLTCLFMIPIKFWLHMFLILVTRKGPIDHVGVKQHWKLNIFISAKASYIIMLCSVPEGSLILGIGYMFFIVIVFISLQSMYICCIMSFVTNFANL